MAEYVPLRTTDGDEDPSFEEAKSNTPTRGASSPKSSRLASWLMILTSAASLLSAVYLHTTSSMPSLDLSNPRMVAKLPELKPYPNLQTLGKLKHSKQNPKLWFPGVMIRANAAQPQTVYKSGSTVVVSKTDSMFYRWRVHHAPETRCYIIAMVPEPTPLAASTKPYVAEGNVSAIEIWNVTHPGPLHSLSWNTRPQRVSLLGTVEFAPPPVYDGHTQDAKELWTPTPMFDCSDDLVLTIEIACQDCRIEFEQTFDPPALAFDLQQLK